MGVIFFCCIYFCLVSGGAVIDLHYFGALGGDFDLVDAPNQSQYYTADQFNQSYSGTLQSLSVCNYNIRNFNANYDFFQPFFQSLQVNFNIIVLTETWFTSGRERTIDGFKGFHSARTLGGGGGVSVYCGGDLDSRILSRFTVLSSSVEACVVKVPFESREVVIVAVYRPPSGSVEEFINYVLSVCSDPSIGSCEFILTGDFNIDLINYDNQTDNYRNFVYSLYSLNFFPLISIPTRLPSGNQHGRPALLDHIWLNTTQLSESGVLLFDCTDHLPTFLILPGFTCSGGSLVKIMFRDHSANNVQKFILTDVLVSTGIWKLVRSAETLRPFVVILIACTVSLFH